MTLSREKTLCLVGCGKMGGAILNGWLESNILPVENIYVRENHVSAELLAAHKKYGFHLNVSDAEIPSQVDIVILAVKPQMMPEVIKELSSVVTGQCYVSVAAGVTLCAYEKELGKDVSIIRIMPNTPISVGRGVSAMIANAVCSSEEKSCAQALFESSGCVVELDSEDQMDVVTGMSGSGPAYVFALIEAYAAAGEAEGLSPKMSMQLARQTVCGAGELAFKSELTPTQLREMVTSPGGTTAAGLAVFRADDGINQLVHKTIKAAAKRSREIS